MTALTTESPGQNARVYLELFGGLTGDSSIISNDHAIRCVDIDMEVGGYQSHLHPYFQVSIYMRESVDSANLGCIFRRQLDPGTGIWLPVKVRAECSYTRARCVVIRVEAVAYSWTPPEDTYEKTYDDQYSMADPPPWGIRISKAVVYASSLKRNVSTHRVLDDILEGGGMERDGGRDYTLDELYFDELPKDRWEAIDDVVAITGDNYAAYGNNVVHFSQPGHGPSYAYAYSDSRTTWDVEKTVDEMYGGIRVGYSNKNGKRREVIVHGGSGPRYEYMDAPDTIKTAKQATRFGERFLAAHGLPGTSGSMTLRGVEALSLRPGGTLNGEPVTGVTINPLDLSASVQFGENSRRFDTWLARVAAGAKPKRR